MAVRSEIFPKNVIIYFSVGSPCLFAKQSDVEKSWYPHPKTDVVVWYLHPLIINVVKYVHL